MRKVYKKITRYIAFILCVVLVLQGFVVPGNGSFHMMAEAADFANVLTYEDDFKVSEGGYDATTIKVASGATFTMNGGTITRRRDV